MRSVPGRRCSAAVVSILLAVGIGAVACAPSRAQWQEPGETVDPPQVEITAPADGATDVPAAAELQFTVTGTNDFTVKFVDAAGAAVAGEMRPDGSSWLPAEPLNYATTYTATVTATKSDGTTGQAVSTFTTMPQPENRVRVTSHFGDDAVVGVGMPIIIRLGRKIPQAHRPEIERRLFVTSDPPQEGVWHWYVFDTVSGEDVLHYRPKEFWQPGTKVNARIATGGLWFGSGDWYGRNDLTLRFTIGEETIMEVDDAAKQMVVKRGGEVLRTIPVSLGRLPSPNPPHTSIGREETRTSAGTVVIMEKYAKYTFDTRREIEDGYVTDVKYAMRLTQKGEFIHAAPWSVSAQGRRNVSHGCVNMSTENAQWLFDLVRIGDPVIIKGSPPALVDLEWLNGWTDWDIPWEEYVKGSSLPYVPTTTPTAPAGA